MLRKIWIVLGAVALITGAYNSAGAIEVVQKPVVTDDISGGAAEANTWTVCSTGCDYKSIQTAVDNADPGDTIELAAETYFETILLTQSLTFRGAGTGETIVDGTGASPGTGAVFEAVFVEGPGGSSLRLEDMTIQKGPVGVVLQVESNSGLIAAEITITRTLVTGNEGPGIIAPWNGQVIITNSSISENGGAGFQGSNLHAEQSTITSNGGVGITGYDVDIVQSTISDNGGVGAKLSGSSRITNSTISGNHGGGVEDSSATCFFGEGTTISTTTIAGNWSAGIKKTYWHGSCPVGFYPEQLPVVIKSSIVANNVRRDCSRDPGTTIISYGYNLAGDSTCGLIHATDLPNTVPLLLALDDNGGPTLTHGLHPDSPAIDVGGSECEPTDQRGVSRPQDGNGDGVATCDIGAVELASLPVEIDIKPGGFPNSINPRSRGVIPVAILGSDTCDVTDIDVATLAFGPGGASLAHLNGHLQDVNYDGIMDLVTHYRTQDAGIACGDETATLTGETLDGQPIEGSDSIQTVGCRETRRPAIWMKDQDRPDTPRRDGPVNIERK